MKRQVPIAKRVERLGKSLSFSMPLAKEIETGREIARLLKSAPPDNDRALDCWRELTRMEAP